jgi:magnesium-protoporphyrin O-methyltransferase
MAADELQTADSTGSPHSADCCADPRIARHFDRRMRELAAAGEVPEMVHTSRGLLSLLTDVGELRPTVLELGSGSGALTVALLERGATAADGIDLSSQSVATAQRRAAAAGVEERAHFAVGDGAVSAVEAHDWVVLDRVICCYEHKDQLLANSIRAARRRFIFSVPYSTGWRGLITRAAVGVENLTRPFRAPSCRGFVHDVPRIEARLAAAGFTRLRNGRAGSLWYLAVWERPVL